MKRFLSRFLSTSLLAASVMPVFAQNQGEVAKSELSKEILNLNLDVRIDYQRDWNDGHVVNDNTGFEGKYFNLRLDGEIVDNLTYSWRQRFTKQILDGNFFDATDWIYLQYRLKDFTFSAGKEVVAIGGYEYDRAPIDLYSNSVFWNNIPCYDLAATVGYYFTPGDRLKFQASQSPFFTPQNRNMYAYNLMWEGSHDFFQSLWSINMVEYAQNRYINYIALGNKFTFNPVTIEFDFMNRAASHQTFFFKDCSLMAEVSVKPAKRWNVFAKYTYDVNNAHTSADYTVSPGTELNMIGCGVEFFPLLKDRTSLRLHANVFYSWGKNTNPENVMHNKTTIFDVGVKWNMNVLKLKKK